MNPAPWISIAGLSKRYGAVEALVGVDADVYPGQVLALLGDNGAGKSTLVRCLAGIHPPDAGVITRLGQQVRLADPAAATALGIETVHQDLALCGPLDVVANLFLGREIHRLGVLDEHAMETRAGALLTELGVTLPRLRAPVETLSGGQRQAVAVARALLFSPAMVILDEPTAALGVAQAAMVLNLVTSLRQRGLAVVLVSHNLADVFKVADRAVVLRLGRKVADVMLATTTPQQVVAAITGAEQA